MRKSILLNSVLAVICVGLLGYIGWYMLEIPDTCLAPSGELSDYTQMEQSITQIVECLLTSDKDWQIQSMQDIQNYERRMEEAEALNAEIQKQHNDAKAEFLAQQLQRAREQVELLQKMREEASQSVISQGGTGIDFSDIIHLGGTQSPPASADNTMPGKTGDAIVAPKGEQSVTVGGEVKEDTYLGQVTATYICTCEQCYDTTSCGETDVDGNYVLTDGTAIPAGINVTFDGGPTGTFHTGLSSRVSGRNILILCGKHEIAGSGATIYPKVSNDHSVG